MTFTQPITYLLGCASLFILISGCSEPQPGQQPLSSSGRGDNTVVFEQFTYQGMDEVFTTKLPSSQYRNPIVAGFFPDPSITRKGDDYYMVHSSFAYAPGVPVLHSTDLVNWQIIGHALTRESQLDVSGLQVSRGIFAPTIRYHDGLFYMITTSVDKGGNFFVTAQDPAGPWSDPYWLPEIGGIDPDLFFDDNGKVYIAHNDAPEGPPLYEGHRAIWLWEYDLAAKQVVKNSGRVIVNGGVDLSKQPIWIEAPHIYKINDWYYLLCAEGGTADQHSEVVFRTRDLSQPFVPYGHNPILTQRSLDENRENPITTAGHADLVQTSSGQWWAVFLAARAYDKRYYNTGRETFLLPVNWQNEWPHIWPLDKPIPYQLDKPKGLATTQTTQQLSGNFTWQDGFDQPQLNQHWLTLRGIDLSGIHLDNSQLELQASPTSLVDDAQPALLVRRQQHQRYLASTQLSLDIGPGVSAGLVVMQNEKFHYYLGVTPSEQGFTVFLEQADGGLPQRQFSVEITPPTTKQLTLMASANKGQIQFFYQIEGQRHNVGSVWDGRLLSTQVAGGFVGTMIGLHGRVEQN